MNNRGYRIWWSKVAEAKDYKRESKRCGLCMREKKEILRLMTGGPEICLNKRDELLRPFTHKERGNIFMMWASKKMIKGVNIYCDFL